MGPLRPSATLLGCLVCVNCNSKIFQTLHNDCSHIEDVHFPFCAHLIIIFSFLTGVELRHFIHPKCVPGVWIV